MNILASEASEVGGVLGAADFRTLADFRFHVRRFFAFSEETTRAAGVSPAQYQALLAIRAHRGPSAVSITTLTERLFIKINSAVELAQRLEAAGMVTRARSPRDQRRVELTLTDRGADVVERLAVAHLAEHRRGLQELERIVADLAGSSLGPSSLCNL